MTSSTSNFKLTWGLGFSLLLVCAVELEFRNVYTPSKSKHESMIERINREKPDLILVGNSMVEMNINRSLFNEELSKVAGRPLRTTFIYHSGTSAALWYLWTKNSISKSNYAHVPVGFVSGNISTLLSRGIGGREHEIIKDTVDISNEEFFRKYLYSELQSQVAYKDSCYLCYYSPESSRKLVHLLSENLYKWLSNYSGPADQFKMRDTLKKRLGNFNFVEAPKVAEMPRKKLSAQDSVEGSFIPDILESLHQSKVFFVLTPPRSTPEYKIKRLNDYKNVMANIASRDARILDLAPEEELAPHSYYVDSSHMTPDGRDLMTRILAHRLISNNFVAIKNQLSQN